MFTSSTDRVPTGDGPTPSCWAVVCGTVCWMLATIGKVDSLVSAEPYSDYQGTGETVMSSLFERRSEQVASPGHVSGGQEVDQEQRFRASAVDATPMQPFAGAGLAGDEEWTWRWFPGGVVYPAYLAGTKEPRLASVWSHDSTLGWMWDISVGGRISLLRFGAHRTKQPEGLEIGLEGAAFPRFDLTNDMNLASVDYRLGIPLTIGFHGLQAKLAVCHFRSQYGHDFLSRFPGSDESDYSRTLFVWGVSFCVTDSLRLYEEAAYSFFKGRASDWEMQFGLDYCPSPNGAKGAPFVALNAHTRPEVDYNRNFTVQAGWQWRNARNGLLRTGVQYTYGKSEQLHYCSRNEERIGVGIWYDF